MTYSNCLFEAIMAKLKDPAHVRIVRFPYFLAHRLHFGWTDGEYLYHAYDPRFRKKSRLRRTLEPVYRYRTKKIPRIVFEAYLCDRLRIKPPAFQTKILKKLGVHLAEIPYTMPEDGWCWMFKGDKLPAEEDVRYLEQIFWGPVFIKVAKTDKYIKTMTYEQVIKIKARNGWKWRYVTPLEKLDFDALYDTHLRVRAKEVQTMEGDE